MRARAGGSRLLIAVVAALVAAVAVSAVAPAQGPPPPVSGEQPDPRPSGEYPPVPEPSAALRRAGFVAVRALAPSIRTDVRYATRRNFTGAVVPGYCEPLAVMKRGAAQDLAAVQRRLAPRGLGLLVYDAYRPARATRSFVRWAERTGNARLLSQGYIARRSRHNEGTTVDLTLATLRTGRAVTMGTAFDAFTTRSHTANAGGAALRNRLTLKRAMKAEGFRNYRREWWHYDHVRLRGPRPDLTLGC
jgi:D-alanyl-D-alanine dipeptidase